MTYDIKKYLRIIEAKESDNTASALVITCMDHRMIDHQVKYLESIDHLKNQFDDFVLAGASLGVVKHSNWASVFWDHVTLALKLHKIKEIVVIDHRDCGAYKAEYGDLSNDLEKELKVHTDNLLKMKSMINKKFPELSVELVLMGLDGHCEKIK